MTPPHPRSFLPSLVIAAFLSFGVLVSQASPAAANLQICNQTASRVGVAIGYRDDRGWVTEGWWNMVPGACETLLEGALRARYYYVHAVDYDRGGEWGGQYFMCTHARVFTIREAADCPTRGYERTGFFEIDTGELTSWTIQLTDPGRGGAAAQGTAQGVGARP
jgi:uncharacterized membrane protein